MRGLRRRDLASLILGGGCLLAYGIADVLTMLLAHARTLRQFAVIWTIGLPAAAALSGLLLAIPLTNLILAKACSRFLQPLPLSLQARRRAVGLAAALIGGLLTLPLAGLAGLAAFVVAVDDPFVNGLRAAAAFILAFGAVAAAKVRRMRLFDHAEHPDGQSRRAIALPWLETLDRAPLRWFNSWAWRLRAGGAACSVPWLAAVAAVSTAASLAIGTSLATRSAAPAAVGATASGLAMFMLTVRCCPLASAALRASPVGFLQAWLRLMRLPSLISAVSFALPASVTLAADPSGWAAPIGGGFMLMALNCCYGVFAAYFANAPVAAAIGFIATIAYAYYESFEYGRTVVLVVVGMVAWLWGRAYRRYRYESY